MTRKISNIILSFVLLIATVGFTINLHYCAGDLYSIAIDSDADNCCEDENNMGHMKNMDHNSQCHNEESNDNHCGDESIVVKISDGFTRTVQNIDISNSVIITLFNTLLFDVYNIYTSFEESTELFNHSDSPPNIRQILSLYQNFLL